MDEKDEVLDIKKGLQILKQDSSYDKKAFDKISSLLDQTVSNIDDIKELVVMIRRQIGEGTDDEEGHSRSALRT